MTRALLLLPRPDVTHRLREIQAQWSPAERRARASEGRRRREQLFGIIACPTEPEIWAVGAPGNDDLPRLAG